MEDRYYIAIDDIKFPRKMIGFQGFVQARYEYGDARKSDKGKIYHFIDEYLNSDPDMISDGMIYRSGS